MAPPIPSLPSHLVEADGAYWTFWRTACLRGSGFPVHLITDLAAPNCALAADQFLALEAEVNLRRSEAQTAYQQQILQTANEQERKTLYSGLKRLRKGKLPGLPPGVETQLAVQRLSDAILNATDARNRFNEGFQTATAGISEKLRRVASEPTFRRAVLLQNGHAFSRALRSLERQSFGERSRGFKERQNEELIANYMQRYCAKNDTIGFFGPVGWARFDPEIEGMSAHAGPALVSSSSTYFENWCVEALAENIARNRAILPWLAPRLSPYFWIEADTLHSPGGGRSKLSPVEAAILQQCRGAKTAREIALEITNTSRTQVAGESQVYEILQQFLSRRIVSWNLELPLDTHPERRLRALLQRIESEPLRTQAIGALDELEQAKQNVSSCPGDPDHLEQSLEALNRTFTRITGKPATRLPGQMYAGRTLIYQDCRRAIDVGIGSDVVRSLASPLSLVLDSARWVSWEIARLYRDAFHRIHTDLAARTGKACLNLLQFWTVAEPLFLDPKKRLSVLVTPELQRRWGEVLGEIPWEEHCLHYPTDTLRPRVAEVFAAPGPGWQLAKYHSPDIMIAAPGPEAINRGDYFFVLGELHATMNTLRYAFNLTQHQNPSELVDAISRDFTSPRVIPVFSRQWPRITNRTSVVLCSPRDYHLEISPQLANWPRSQVLPISEFVVEHCDTGLTVRTLDGRLKFDVIEFFGEMLCPLAGHGMDFIPSVAHTPRIALDDLVIRRESWSFFAGEVNFIHEKNEHDRFLEVRRWMRKHAMPRFVFARLPMEVKPFYVDFDNPIYLEILTKKIRKTLASNGSHEPITITEMLPAPDELWLPDHKGYRYTSELRIVAKDLKAPAAPLELRSLQVSAAD